MYTRRGHLIVHKPAGSYLCSGEGWYDYACGKSPELISRFTLKRLQPSVPSRVTCKLCLRTKAFKELANDPA